jgi:hypothetical protein
MKLRTWLLNRHNARSRRQSFRQEGFEKKELTLEEINKREWKRKKSLSRDKNPWTYGGGKHKKFSCKHGHRSERKEMKQCLKKGDWEAYSKSYPTWIEDPDYDIISSESFYLPNEWDDFLQRKRKNYIDPWDWY